MSAKTQKPTAAQQKFIDCWNGNCRESAAIAGISYAHARDLLTRDYIKQAIRNRPENREVIADRRERQQFWTHIMRDENEATAGRLRASELLGKSETDFCKKPDTGNNFSFTDFVKAISERRKKEASQMPTAIDNNGIGNVLTDRETSSRYLTSASLSDKNEEHRP